MPGFNVRVLQIEPTDSAGGCASYCRPIKWTSTNKKGIKTHVIWVQADVDYSLLVTGKPDMNDTHFRVMMYDNDGDVAPDQSQTYELSVQTHLVEKVTSHNCLYHMWEFSTMDGNVCLAVKVKIAPQ
eukprot:2222138-Rhodomonas_salina.2